MTMHVLDRPGIARRVAKTYAAIGAVAAVLVGMTAFALPAGSEDTPAHAHVHRAHDPVR